MSRPRRYHETRSDEHEANPTLSPGRPEAKGDPGRSLATEDGFDVLTPADKILAKCVESQRAAQALRSAAR